MVASATARMTEARFAIEPAAGELAARNATEDDIERIESADLQMRCAFPDDVDACCAADLDFHASILKTSVISYSKSCKHDAAALNATFHTATQLAKSLSQKSL